MTRMTSFFCKCVHAKGTTYRCQTNEKGSSQKKLWYHVSGKKTLKFGTKQVDKGEISIVMGKGTSLFTVKISPLPTRFFLTPNSSYRCFLDRW